MFQSQLIKTDVTAVKLVENFILAGIGNFLHIFDKKGNFIKKLKIFNGHKIHGIEIDDTNFFLYGGCSIQTLKCDLDSLQVKFVCNKQIQDWVLTARWLRNGLVGTVVMKNALLIFNEDLVVQRQVLCGEKCILYSAFISYDNVNELVIFSGTVFSEILIWKVSQNEERDSSVVLAKLKGHNGVIFSVNYNPSVGYICSSSDDRSSILWSVESKCIHTELARKSPEITLVRKFYGHQSRIFRSVVLDDVLVTAGEDSILNVWDFKGELLNKITANQGGPIWAFDCRNGMIVSGGGSCGVLLAPIKNSLSSRQLILPNNESPKHVGFVRDANVVVITESGTLYSNYGNPTGQLVLVQRHQDLSGYCILEISKCRNLFALAGYCGEIYIYQLRETSIVLLVAFKTEQPLRIYSIHWITCQTFLTCQQNGLLNLWYLDKNHPILITTFHLPAKETKGLWTTTACQGPNGKYIVANRRGNIFVYELKSSTPIQVFKKVHSLGITQLHSYNENMLSLGRDGNINTFLWTDKGIEHFSTDKVPFSWLLTLTPENLLLAFSGNTFIVWDYKTRRKLQEYVCGGGHRSWDFCKTKSSTVFCFVKGRTINQIDWNHKSCLEVVSDYHFNTTNSVAVVSLKDKFVLVSGSDDTNLRISVVGDDFFDCVKNFKSHLSNIKAVCVHGLSDGGYLMFTGGGRGQIICWTLIFQENEQSLCRQEYSLYKETNKDSLESEIRIMDLKVMETEKGDLVLFAAASDGNVDVFDVEKVTSRFGLQLRKKLFRRVKCVTKLCLLRKPLFGGCVLVTMSTDGNFTFWDVSRVLEEDVAPFQVIGVHQSAVTACSFRFIDHTRGLFVSGGDDGCIVVSLFRIEANCVIRVEEFRDAFSHCAQVTGTWISADYFFTTSVDQKLLVFQWSVDEDRLCCKYRARYDSAVADIQGMSCEEDENYFHVFLYGKGLEYVKVAKKTL